MLTFSAFLAAAFEPAIGLSERRANVRKGTGATRGISGGADITAKVNPLFVHVFPKFVR